MIGELLKDIRENLGCMYHLAEIVAMIDMLNAIANSCRGSDYGWFKHLLAISVEIINYNKIDY